MGVKSICFNHEIIKTHSTVAFSTFYTMHFFRQFVALKKSRRQFIFLFTPGLNSCFSVSFLTSLEEEPIQGDKMSR